MPDNDAFIAFSDQLQLCIGLLLPGEARDHQQILQKLPISFRHQGMSRPLKFGSCQHVWQLDSMAWECCLAYKDLESHSMPLQDATDLLRYGLGCQCTPIATGIKCKQDRLWTAFIQQRGFLQPQAAQPCTQPFR